MLPWPMVHREMKLAARRRDTFVLRTMLALGLGAIVTAIIWGTQDSRAFSHAAFPEVELKHIGEAALGAVLAVEGLVAFILVPGMLRGAIAEERAKNTLAALLLTRLSPGQIVLAKLVGRLPQAWSPLAVGLPLILLAAWAAAMPPTVVALTTLVCFSTVDLVASLAILSSARDKGTSTRPAGNGFYAFLVLILIPLAPRYPVAWAGRFSVPVEALQAACALLAPASPLSLITDPRWLSSRTYDPLAMRLVTMFGVQLLVAALAVLGASASLDVRERDKQKNLSRLNDPYRGYRPGCRDDPILWREYELPHRRGLLPKTLIILLCILDSIRILGPYIWFCVRHLVRIVQLLFMLAYQLGPFVAGIWFGYPAFVELGRSGLFATDEYQDRTRFNLMLRTVTALLGLIGMAHVIETTVRRITQERDKGTWTALLTTPLTGAEILGSKMRASILPWIDGMKSLPVLLIAGALCGALHPLGLLFIAVDLPLAFWAAAAVGSSIALRNPTTRGAHTSAALAALGFLLVHGTLLMAALSSYRDVRTVLLWDRRVFWAIAALLVVVPPATGALAWNLTRRAFEQFDELVGRPHRSPAAEIARTKAAAAEERLPVGAGR